MGDSFFYNYYYYYYLRNDLPFSRKSDGKNEKNVVSFTHEENIICRKTQLDDISHEQAIICRQLFAGHLEGSRPMKRQTNLYRKIMLIRVLSLSDKERTRKATIRK